LLAKVRKLRDHGRSGKYEHEEVGYGERLDALQAAVLSVKLSYLNGWTEARQRNARLYADLLADVEVVTAAEVPGVRHVYHLYVLRTPHRDALLAHLKAHGVGTGVHYPLPVHRQPAYLKLGYGNVALPQAERAAAEVLSVPMYAELMVEQIDHVV